MPDNKEKQKLMPTVDVAYQVDTLDQPWRRGFKYDRQDNRIDFAHVLGEDETNRKNFSDEKIVHEQKRRTNYQNGIYEYALSTEQAYKVSMHDHISADMAELIALRQQYLENKDESVFDGTPFGFYAEALKTGEIDPTSKDPEAFNKEMSLIVNGTRDKYKPSYANAADATFFGEDDGAHAQYYDQNYQRAKKICYNIGGVDFTKYMDHDVEISQNSHLDILAYKKNLTNAEAAELYNVPAYKADMSLQQYQDLVQQTLAMNEGYHWGDTSQSEYEGQTVGDVWKESIARVALNHSPDLNLENIYRDGMVKSASLASSITNDVAREYQKKGIPVGVQNDAAYNKALKELYSVSLDGKNVDVSGIINPQYTDFTQSISDEAQAVQDMNKWALTRQRVSNTLASFSKGNVQNEIVHPQENEKNNHGTPLYAPQSSDFMHRVVPDMTGDVIEKPKKQDPAQTLLEKTGRLNPPKAPAVSKISDAPASTLQHMRESEGR